jgi:hypothetical protein
MTQGLLDQPDDMMTSPDLVHAFARVPGARSRDDSARSGGRESDGTDQRQGDSVRR